VATEVRASGAIAAGVPLDGPAIVEEPNTTIVVPPGWRAVLHEAEQSYVLTRTGDDG
jgi:N-methylhydantoinase A/oxoprolinase/acetone carboxylase beta subunit